MKHRYPLLICTFIGALALLSLLLLLPATAQSSPATAAWQDKLAPELQEALASLPAGDKAPPTPIPVILYLTSQADLAPAGLPSDPTARRRAVVQRLQETAQQSQAGLLSQLDQLTAAGSVQHYHPFWIINAIALTADASALQTLAARPEIRHIGPDSPVQLERFDQSLLPDEAAIPTQIITGRGQSLPAGLSAWGIDRIRAAHVWRGLGIDGHGITVGIMDSGVDWLHPDLYGSYRGNLGNGSVNHADNWFDAVDWQNVAPQDPYGHGTHVAGTIAGQNGIGVAPGAQWIAARAFDDHGYSAFSVLHAAFEWLLAPNGRPELAPDVINGSWGANPLVSEFIADIDALNAAGTVTVFSAGNSGQTAGSIATPAGYANTIAVAASDSRDKIAWFSSAGPSVFTGREKPDLAAPGTRILSAYPGNRYALANGTSMASPHVAGTIALLLAANPSLTRPDLTYILTSTAIPLDPSFPNNLGGWGRLDAYAAVQTQLTAATGRVQATVRQAGQPLVGVAITLTTPAGAAIPFTTDAAGQFSATLLPDLYDLRASAFGYAPRHIPHVGVQIGHTTNLNIELTPLARGTLSGYIYEQDTLIPLPATIHLAGTPITVTAAANGFYSVDLPAGTYNLHIAHTGHQLAHTSQQVSAGSTTSSSFFLPPARRILLVDSGQWYYDSQTAPYRAALQDLNLAYDQWPIYNPIHEVPTLDDLRPYDAVLWSAPKDSPGLINAGTVISHYLGLGKDLFISGQNVGGFDGGSLAEAWWSTAMRGQYLDQLLPEPGLTITGRGDSIFSGLTLNLNSGDAAHNQDSLDVVAPGINSFTSTSFTYPDGRGAGLLRGRCVAKGYHIAYLAFGLEGVSTPAGRSALLDRSFTYFDRPLDPAGVEFSPAHIDDIALNGRTYTYTLRLFNASETLTDTFSLAMSGASWPTHVLSPTITLGPCQAIDTSVTVRTPAALPEGSVYDFTLTALSANDAQFTATSRITLKTPENILLVDDHLFYDQTPLYRAALDNLGLRYDVWQTGWAGTGRGTPPDELLQAYDFVLWYTGYDWFAPVNASEAGALVRYLDQGGRLFLSSQDYLYYNRNNPLTPYLGVLDFQESVTPTLVLGGANSLAGDVAPLPLAFAPYQNNADALVPAGNSQVLLWHNGGGAAGLGTAGHGPAGSVWRTSFWGIPLEKLPAAAQPLALAQALGWLSDLGGSQFAVSQRSAPAGASLSYTITLPNNAATATAASLTNTLPISLTLDPASLTGGAAYDPTTRRITWQGLIPAGAEHQISYRAQPLATLPAGAAIPNPVAITDGRHHLTFSQTATTWVDAPDTGTAWLQASANPLPAGQNVTLTVRLPNHGTAGTISATVRLPAPLTPLTGTLASSSGTALLRPGHLTWQGNLAAGELVTFSLVLTSTFSTQPQVLPLTLIVADGVTHPVVQPLWLWVAPYQQFQPLIWRP